MSFCAILAINSAENGFVDHKKCCRPERQRLIRRVKYVVFMCGMLMLAAICGAAASKFHERTVSNQFPTVSNASKPHVRFWGTTSFLFDDGKTQFIVDGFVTRARHGLLHRFGPSGEQLLKVVKHYGVCRSPAPVRQSNQPSHCRNTPGRGLAYIIPVHGHYDHALDAPSWAAWSGAPLIADPSLRAVVEAASSYKGVRLNDFNWRSIALHWPFSDDRSQSASLSAGTFKIELIKTPHIRNAVSPLLAGRTKKGFKFPTTIWNMKEGTPLSVLVTHENKRVLIVPSAGKIGDIFRNRNLQARTVILGIGGLGFKSRATIEEFWRDTVLAVGAKQVILVHWDDDQAAIPTSDNVSFRVASPRNFNRTFEIFARLAPAAPGRSVEILFPPGSEPFNPF
jgi:L-ascorbate metabolism protein UlaG (beta-lactamase superfamily)